MIEDVEGKTYIDFGGGIGVVNVGHCNEKVVAAIQDQAQQYLHTCFHISMYEPYVALAKRLNEITPGTFQRKPFSSTVVLRLWKTPSRSPVTPQKNKASSPLKTLFTGGPIWV
jgi:hypothetical protein